MELKKLIEKSNLTISKENILYKEPMRKHTSFKIGGNAECLIIIKSIKDLKEILKFIKENNIPLTTIGNGSNILVLDNGIKGITLKMNLVDLEIKYKEENVEIKVGSGYKLSMLARKITKSRNRRI